MYVKGDLIGGVSSDAFGRRRTLVVMCLVHMVAAYSAIFVRTYWLYVFVRLFIGGTAHAAWSILVRVWCYRFLKSCVKAYL
jgi:MFS family permease